MAYDIRFITLQTLVGHPNPDVSSSTRFPKTGMFQSLLSLSWPQLQKTSRTVLPMTTLGPFGIHQRQRVTCVFSHVSFTNSNALVISPNTKVYIYHIQYILCCKQYVYITQIYVYLTYWQEPTTVELCQKLQETARFSDQCTTTKKGSPLQERADSMSMVTHFHDCILEYVHTGSKCRLIIYYEIMNIQRIPRKQTDTTSL